MKILPFISILLVVSFIQGKGTLDVYWVDV
ncbi:uncharacterized protein METZ01_LOCUS156475, partial [marine metagenome]